MLKLQYGLLAALLTGAYTLQASSGGAEIHTLDPYVVYPATVANESPLPTYSNPISSLSYEPAVDVQNRNFAEAQGDISIRGGIFENTGFNISTLSIFDPQTGHYLAELPIDPMMLDLPEVRTGFTNQISAFNATAGSVRYLWRPVSVDESYLKLTLGENSLNTQSFYTAYNLSDSTSEDFIDFGLSRSESDGTIKNGDHEFKRISARYTHRDDRSRFTLFGGYQDKFFGWPNMYTPFNVDETEDIQTLLLLSEYDLKINPDTELTISGYYRENRDDYEYDRYRPGIYNPYEHKTLVSALHADLRHQSSDNNSLYYLSGDVFFDSIDSTTLTNSFQSRSYGKLQAGMEYALGERMEIQANLALNDTNRDAAMLNPGIRLEYDASQPGSEASSVWYAEYSRSSQVSGYTAIGSPPSGLFAGNPNLGVERNQNFELGWLYTRAKVAFKLTGFYRMDRDLTDWTFSYAKTNARTANPVDIDTFGIETFLKMDLGSGWFAFGYTYLRKDEDYSSPDIDASFYALNFPEHRTTLSIAYRLTEHLELRMDNEYRLQRENALRQSGDHALLSYLSLVYKPLLDTPWDLCLSVDNLWDEDFEEIPAVPASRRQFAVQSTYSW